MLSQRLRYLAWSAVHRPLADISCPICGRPDTHVLRRKYVVTELRECATCAIRFRIPKDHVADSEQFYQDGYEQGFTTDCPAEAELAKLVACCFAGCERDYRPWIEVLHAAGVREGETVYDYGCSWGYGVWQLHHAGFNAIGWDVSKPRRDYAARKLECSIMPPQDLRGPLDCFFAAHIIEHLPRPHDMFSLAYSLIKRSSGRLVVICPNGDPVVEHLNPSYHRLWGQVHPMLLSAKSLVWIARKAGFKRTSVHSSPYDLNSIRASRDSAVHGADLLLIAAS